MSSKILGPSDFTTMPWRNGLGSTIEMLKHQTDDTFKWRLSMADVTEDGVFSDFSGYDRCLLLLTGQGLTLTDATGQTWPLSQALDAAHFKGEDAIHAQLTQGPIKDFNLMTRRKDVTAEVFTSQTSQRQSIPLAGDLFFLYSTEGPTHVALTHTYNGHARQTNDTSQTVPAQHLLQIEASNAHSVTCDGNGWIGIIIRYRQSNKNLENK